MSKDFFPPRPDARPTIYAYTDSNPLYEGLLKVGYTTRDVRARVAEQYPTRRPGPPPYTIVLEEPAMRRDGTTFTDRDVHRQLRDVGVANPEGEWFRVTVGQLRKAVRALQKGRDDDRSLDFALRPEQEAAVAQTAAYFTRMTREKKNRSGFVPTPRFLWNAKMRFGKTFTAYKLAQRMGWRKLLVLTFKPAVQTAWGEDLRNHVDFAGWQFVSRDGLSVEEIDPARPFVYFGSFQDHLGRDRATGGIKVKNEWVHATHWDCVIFDEYHYGAWREKAKELFEAEGDAEESFGMGAGIQLLDDDGLEIIPITTDAYLCLSGTPFRAIAGGEFIEEQIFNWTYSDEQRAKRDWNDGAKPNPYASLPRMVLMTYQLPDAVRRIAGMGEFDQFDLNTFFKAKGHGDDARFLYENEVQKWLDLIRGNLWETVPVDLKLGKERPPMPYSDKRLLSVLNHTLWFLPDVAACDAMANLLRARDNVFYHDYEVVVAAGSKAGIGPRALPPVEKAMDPPLETKTITLTCGKLLTGVTVRPWTGIFMLRNLTAPETYFQAAFRVQSPWTVRNPDGLHPDAVEILKKECYVFDFAPNRALSQIAEYSSNLNTGEDNPETKVEEFIEFLPVLAYDGSTMTEVDAAGILEMAASGVTATLLARRWESPLLVNVDNDTLKRLMANQAALDALMSIEGFRSLNQDIETIINKSEAVKKVRKEGKELRPPKKEELTKEEKEAKSLRKQIQEKLIKFATRIPVFMYLTDYREHTLKDVITKLEPGLFKKVTGLEVKDFELLVSLNVFNGPLMNDAVYKFKRYEDSSLEYMGVNKHAGEERVGGYDTTLSKAEYRQIFVDQPAES